MGLKLQLTMHITNFVVSGLKLTGLFSANARKIVHLVFSITDISIRFGDIRDRRQKLFEIGPSCACFWLPDYLVS